ncbi:MULTISPECIES: hypothetical protein [Pseudomonas]|jgi:hypothetical protein|uniref:hypothetical protein n=1 Tax=Pseudomonas TaxID=286 RepID=UPI000652D54A|nr:MULTISPECIES: hypothetical protein [Pseudomonas]EKT4558026.1 hypothetical protein [Pseudomonas putida]WPE30046.1 hypothetical protein PshuTeo1_58140 [Pseudomonas hunanensis]BDD36663.1 hypothetical protein [uncultured bacterium]KMN22829.1 hypothetical protein TU85_12025 [Pseudomonas helleri]KMN22889.1 hypothetical protein TU85_12395 [Pseudomonas helleri]
MAKDPTTAREAMVAQMMEDFDAIVRRLEQVDADLAAKTSEAVRDAAGKVLLQTQLNFESMMEEQRNALVQAGREAAARIGNEINRSTANLVSAQAERRAIRYTALLLLVGAALGAAAVLAAVGAGYLIGR